MSNCILQSEHAISGSLKWNKSLCPLHISRSDALIGLRCSRRQIGTKPSDVASAPHSHWPNGAQCVHSRRMVRESHTILYDSLVGTVKESCLLQLSVALYTFGSQSAGGVGQYYMLNIARRPPDGLPMRPWQPIPGREPESESLKLIVRFAPLYLLCCGNIILRAFPL